MKQRCYCLTRHFAPLERRDEEVPQVKAGEILVRISAAGVCHSDIHIWEGHYDLGSDKKITLKDRGIALPLTLGHEIAGEVVAMGPSAQGTAVGTQVVVFPWLGCGVCPTCKRGDENLCQKSRSFGVFQNGGYAEYVVVPEGKYCIDIAGLDPAQAAPLACSGVTTYSAIKKLGAVIHDAPVVIMGAGGLGHMALMMLKALNAKGAIFVEPDATKRAAALKAGALGAIDSNASDWRRRIDDLGFSGRSIHR
jgi:6-hydroxyhexanoate dehydrogenase